MGWEHRWFAVVNDVDSVVTALRHKAGIDSDVGSEVRRDRYFLTGLETVGAKVRDARNTEVHATVPPLPDDEIEIKWRIDRDAGTEKLKKCTLLAKQATRDILTSTLPVPSTVTPLLASMQGSKPASILVDKMRWKADVYVNAESFVGMLSFEMCVCKLVSDPTSWLELGPTAAPALGLHPQQQGAARDSTGSSPGRTSPRPAAGGPSPSPPFTWLSVCVEGSKVPGVLGSAGLDLLTVLPPKARAGVYTGSYSAWLTHCVQPYMVVRNAGDATSPRIGVDGASFTGLSQPVTTQAYAHTQALAHTAPAPSSSSLGHTLPWAHVAGHSADYPSSLSREEGPGGHGGSPGRPPLAHTAAGLRSPPRATAAGAGVGRSAGTQRTPRSAGSLRSEGAGTGRARGSGSADWTGSAAGQGGGSSPSSSASTAPSLPSAAAAAYEASLSDPGPHPLASARAARETGPPGGVEGGGGGGHHRPLDAFFPLHPKQAHGSSSISSDGMILTLRISPRTSPRLAGTAAGGAGAGAGPGTEGKAGQQAAPPATQQLYASRGSSSSGSEDYSTPTAFTAGLLAAAAAAVEQGGAGAGGGAGGQGGATSLA